MSPTRLPLFRPAVISSLLTAAVLAVSLFASMSTAQADDYEDCMAKCTANGGSSKACHEVCERE